MTVSDLAYTAIITASPAIPIDDKGPVFAAPWEARVFAMTLKAHEAGVFTWPEWARMLGAELASDAPSKSYYDHWLAAFEKLLSEKGITSLSVLSDLQNAWDKAARATPHGEPIELKR
ncbi:nitrile hydratase accessory protein [Roseibium algae]|uniref:Nitrile hydratase accessory protein n=1 Tax=Roseibium algae TaxID=3123038 RepID=A0ABU8TJU3_9HYPH